MLRIMYIYCSHVCMLFIMYNRIYNLIISKLSTMQAVIVTLEMVIGGMNAMY